MMPLPPPHIEWQQQRVCPNATHFATKDISPKWAEDMRVVCVIGAHVFYTERRTRTSRRVPEASASETNNPGSTRQRIPRRGSAHGTDLRVADRATSQEGQ